MAECVGGCAALAALETFAGFGLYLGMVFGLRSHFLKQGKPLSPDDFSRTYPRLAALPEIHGGLSLAVLWAAFFGGIWGAEVLKIPPPHRFGAGVLLWTAGMNAFNGAVEWITGVCPIYGAVVRRSSRQQFIVHPAVRTLGRVRLALSGAIAAGVWLIASILF